MRILRILKIRILRIFKMRFKMKSLQVMSLIIATNKNKLYLYIILYYI